MSQRRSIAFLEMDGDESLDAKKIFIGLSDKVRRDLHSRFDHWVDCLIFDDYHHGWTETDRKRCYCFRWRRGTTRYRIYGFLDHPLPHEPRFEVCILAFYAQKNVHDTDPTIIAALNRLSTNADVKRAIQKTYLGEQSNDEIKSKNSRLSKGETEALDRSQR